MLSIKLKNVRSSLCVHCIVLFAVSAGTFVHPLSLSGASAQILERNMKTCDAILYSYQNRNRFCFPGSMSALKSSSASPVVISDSLPPLSLDHSLFMY